MKNRLFLILTTLCLFSTPTAATAEEVTRNIVGIGTWSGDNVNGAQTTYVRVDGDPVGPWACAGNTLKIDMKEAGASGVYTKAILLTALTTQMPVQITVTDQCLYDAPTFQSVWIVR